MRDNNGLLFRYKFHKLYVKFFLLACMFDIKPSFLDDNLYVEFHCGWVNFNHYIFIKISRVYFMILEFSLGQFYHENISRQILLNFCN